MTYFHGDGGKNKALSHIITAWEWSNPTIVPCQHLTAGAQLERSWPGGNVLGQMGAY